MTVSNSNKNTKLQTFSLYHLDHWVVDAELLILLIVDDPDADIHPFPLAKGLEEDLHLINVIIRIIGMAGLLISLSVLLSARARVMGDGHLGNLDIVTD